MSNNHGAATADDPMDMAEHESTYAAFVALTETTVVRISVRPVDARAVGA